MGWLACTAKQCSIGRDEGRSGRVQHGIANDLVTPVSECELCIAEDLDYFDEDQDGYLSEDSLDPDDMTYEVCCLHQVQPHLQVYRH